MGATALTLTLLLLTAKLVSASSPCYDHQTETYSTRFKPAGCDSDCSITPFFSPDHSVDAYVRTINDAESTIDLLEPDFKSWGSCTHYTKECGGDCIGCTLEDQYNETFPIFPALLNAIHLRGVSVRFLTNDFAVPTCKGLITPLDWLAVNGVDIKLYRTTTFMHAKFMIIDGGKKVLISSVNFSKTSFTKNREAGVIISDCQCAVQDLYASVVKNDMDTAFDYKVTNDYSSKDLAFIRKKTEMRIPPVPEPNIPNVYVTKMNLYKDVQLLTGFTAPDNARSTFMSALDGVTSSLQVHIYQITDTDICQKLLDLHKQGVNVTLLVGSYIVSYNDYELAQKCYQKLYSGGMQGRIQKSYTKFSFSHQKYWIIDGKEVHLSTGNWSPSDFPTEDTFPPYAKTQHSVNRDMLVAMRGTGVVDDFNTVFTEDWWIGNEWKPKSGISYGPREYDI